MGDSFAQREGRDVVIDKHPQFALVQNDIDALYDIVNGGLGIKNLGSLDHDELSNVTEDQHHARQHALDSTDDHTSSIVENNYLVANASGLPRDSDRSMDADNDVFERTGFPNRTDSTISFNDGNLTFSIAPVATNFDIYFSSKKFTSTGDTVTIPDTDGLHYIYFDYADNDLKTTMTFSSALILQHVLASIVYWNSSLSRGIIVSDERHGEGMSSATHLAIHNGFGTQWWNGLGLTDILADQSGALDTHAQLGFAIGTIADEDIIFSIAADAGPATIPVFYLSGAGLWNSDADTGFPVKRFGASRLAWNELSGGTWGQTEVANQKFVLSHIIATTDINTPVIAIQGQAQYANISAARQGATTELNNLVLSGLPSVEWTPLASVIYQTSNGYTNAVQARIRTTDLGGDYVDWRFEDKTSSIGVTTDHGALSGLDDQDHPAYAIFTSGSNFSGNLSPADTSVQVALQTIDQLSIGSGAGGGLSYYNNDPAGSDLTAGDFTKDNTWNTLDVSTYIVTGATNVLMAVAVSNTGGATRRALFRRGGNSNQVEISEARPGEVNTTFNWTVRCPVNTGGEIEYNISTLGWAALNVTFIADGNG